MKKSIRMMSILLAVVLVSLPFAGSALASTRCMHSYELVDEYHSGYGPLYYQVSQCPYASYPHQHFHLGTTVVYTYVCKYCDHVKTVVEQHIDHDAGDVCTQHDVGKSVVLSE